MLTTPRARAVSPAATLFLATALAVLVALPAVGAPDDARHPVASTFAVSGASLAPGSVSRVTLATPATPLRSGRLELKFSPPIFLDVPSVSFPDAPADLAFGLAALGAGRYAVEFALPGYAEDLAGGQRLVISGVLSPGLRIGGQVNVRIDGVATASDGSEIGTGPRDVMLPLIGDPYPLLTVHVLDRYDLVPGTTANIELQTYNPKPISDGQICLRLDRSVFTSVESVGVQGERDVSYVTETDATGALIVRFTSPSSSLNRFEGALVQLGLRVAADLPPGLETVVHVDVPQSFLRDHNGDLVPLGGDDGYFRVAPSGD